MLNKYLKKILLTTVALFWASCDDSSSVDYGAPEYGCPSDYCGAPAPGPDETTPSSSSEESASGNAAQSSSSVIAQSSSSMIAGSSSDVVGSSSEMASSSSNFDPNSVPSDTLYGVPVTEKTCVPGDSVISYYPPAYSAEVLKMGAKQRADIEIVDLIDSIVDPRPKAERAEAPLDSINWSNFPRCLKEMKDSLERFVALYGAPVHVVTEEVCSDGTKRPTKEYQEYQKMMEEWEANKPALNEEVNKIFEDRFKELEQKLKQCRESAAGNEQ